MKGMLSLALNVQELDIEKKDGDLLLKKWHSAAISGDDRFNMTE